MSGAEKPPKFKFAEGEKVLCFHGPIIYEAKLLRCQVTKDKQVKYFIHYAGWNKNWDEWVPENRVLKYNDANVQRQKEVSKLHASSGSAKNKKGAIAATAAAAKPKKTDSTSSSGKDADSRASTPSKELKDAAAVAASTPAGTPAPRSAATTPVPTAGSAATANTSATTSSAAPAATATPTQTTAPVTIASATSTTTSTPATTASSSTTTGSSRSGRSSSKPSSTAAPANLSESKDEATKKKRARLDTSASTTPASSTSSATAASAAASTAAATLAASAETEEQFHAKVEVRIKIPDELKPWLVDDWDAINRQQKLIELPAKKTVQDIVNAYIVHKKTSKNILYNNKGPILDITTSLLSYFDVMLGCQLLYKFERPQYAEIIELHPNKPMSELYGSFHLLRLFTKLGTMLSFTNLDEKSVQLLLVHLQDFLKYLVKNQSTLFSIQQFVNVTSAYHRKVQ